jgi:hypothetical protein
MLRPETLAFVATSAPGALAARVEERRYAGAASRFRVVTERGRELEVLAPSSAARVGDLVAVAPHGAGPPGRIWAAPGETPP